MVSSLPWLVSLTQVVGHPSYQLGALADAQPPSTAASAYSPLGNMSLLETQMQQLQLQGLQPTAQLQQLQGLQQAQVAPLSGLQGLQTTAGNQLYPQAAIQQLPYSVLAQPLQSAMAGLPQPSTQLNMQSIQATQQAILPAYPAAIIYQTQPTPVLPNASVYASAGGGGLGPNPAALALAGSAGSALTAALSVPAPPIVNLAEVLLDVPDNRIGVVLGAFAGMLRVSAAHTVSARPPNSVRATCHSCNMLAMPHCLHPQVGFHATSACVLLSYVVGRITRLLFCVLNVGKGGATLEGLKRLLSVRISVSRREPGMAPTAPRRLTITGAAPNVATAQLVITQKLQAFQSRKGARAVQHAAAAAVAAAEGVDAADLASAVSVTAAMSAAMATEAAAAAAGVPVAEGVLGPHWLAQAQTQGTLALEHLVNASLTLPAELPYMPAQPTGIVDVPVLSSTGHSGSAHSGSVNSGSGHSGTMGFADINAAIGSGFPA